MRERHEIENNFKLQIVDNYLVDNKTFGRYKIAKQPGVVLRKSEFWDLNFYTWHPFCEITAIDGSKL